MENKIQYVGEQLWYGYLGHALVVGAFIAALLSAYAFFNANNKKLSVHEANAWDRLGKGAFITHAAMIFGIFVLILSMMYGQRYEYHYVWSHVSADVPKEFILAAFWEGQEGSFLLWIFWHAILGIFLFRQRDHWDRAVIPFLALVQAFLLTMVMGVYLPFFDGVKIGSSPFSLLRNEMLAPIFSQATYLAQIKGNGLNVLLQNYWMTIHPPTLFLGFAACTIPFCFALGALQTGRHTEWLRKVQPHALFAGAILGLGILMGAAWAYEALSFNGYWAWDPVENMSLVPWLVMIAGIHTNLIARATNRNIKSTYWFYIGSFLLVLYSTFLTRSGILGDSSAHAFTEMGLEWQLVLFLGFFTLLSFWMYFKNNKNIPVLPQEESISSREFWMFIGSIIFIFSAVLITFTTSIPVYNKILDGIGSLSGNDLKSYHRAMPLEPIAHYNKFQLWIAVFMAFISGFAYYLKYKQSGISAAVKKNIIQYTGISLAIATLLTVITSVTIDLSAWQYYLLCFAAWYTFTANLIYFIRFMRNQTKAAGSLLSHMGFGLMLIGIIASGLNKQFISSNPFTQKGLISDEDLGKNILIFKNNPAIMSGYEVTYTHDTIEKNIRSYQIEFQQLDENGNKNGKNFILHPTVVYDRNMTKLAAVNPSTRRTLFKDLYTHIASLPPEEINFEQAKAKEDSLKYQEIDLSVGQSFKTEKHELTVTGYHINPTLPQYTPEPGDLAISLDLTVKDLKHDTSINAKPAIVLRKESVLNYPAQLNLFATKIQLNTKLFEKLFESAGKNIQTQIVKIGDTLDLGDQKVILANFKKMEASNQHIKVGAEIQNLNHETIGLPVMEIAGNDIIANPVLLKNTANFISFVRLDPTSESATFEINTMGSKQMKYPLRIAENSLRSDYIVLEAVIFPGINFFWIGSLIMLSGIGIAFYYRYNLNKKKNDI